MTMMMMMMMMMMMIIIIIIFNDIIIIKTRKYEANITHYLHAQLSLTRVVSFSVESLELSATQAQLNSSIPSNNQ